MLAIQLIYFNFFFCGRKHNLIAALSNSLFYCLLIKKKVAQIHQDLPVDPCYLLSTIIFVVSFPAARAGVTQCSPPPLRDSGPSGCEEDYMYLLKIFSLCLQPMGGCSSAVAPEDPNGGQQTVKNSWCACCGSR